jgi:hypothetical protein
MTSTRRTATTAGRRLSQGVLVGLVALVALLVGPGVAQAAGVTPTASCYQPNSDGTVSVLLGYDNTSGVTQTIPRGASNVISPSAYDGAQPTRCLRAHPPGQRRLVGQLDPRRRDAERSDRGQPVPGRHGAARRRQRTRHDDGDAGRRCGRRRRPRGVPPARTSRHRLRRRDRTTGLRCPSSPRGWTPSPARARTRCPSSGARCPGTSRTPAAAARPGRRTPAGTAGTRR